MEGVSERYLSVRKNKNPKDRGGLSIGLETSPLASLTADAPGQLQDQPSDSNLASRRMVFAVAGALSLLLLYIAFDTAMGLSGVLVASGRTLGGLMAHVATGVVSGLIFAIFTNSPGEAAVSDGVAGS